MTDPHITILMATCNGARFLPAQLDSLLAQSHTNWSLMVGDDGSCDGTADILRAFDRAHPNRNVQFLEGPRSGTPTQNFMALLTHRDVPPEYVALADQDDVWLPQKLARAVDHLAQSPENLPALYAAESILTDANLRPIGRSAEPHARPSFRNALVQNLFAGHSIVLNASAVALVRDAGAPSAIHFHDWWLYQLIAGAGGACLLDPAQTTLYRQHGGNAFGASHGFSGALKRLNHLLRNDYGMWLAAHWQALHDAAPHLTPDARDVIRDLLDRTTDQNRATQFRRLGLKRGSAHGTAALWLAARLGRI